MIVFAGTVSCIAGANLQAATGQLKAVLPTGEFVFPIGEMFEEREMGSFGNEWNAWKDER